MPNTPYVAIICTVERLTLRDTANTIGFNVNLSTTVVQNGASNHDVAAFVLPPARSGPSGPGFGLLQMWKQTLDTDPGTHNILFDVFSVGTGSAATYVGNIGTAPPPTTSVAAPCLSALSDELFALCTAAQSELNKDLAPLLWNPTDPAASDPPSSLYQLTPWRNTVAHASTWPKPIPQELYLSFEVSVPAGAVTSGSILIFPRFTGPESVPSANSVSATAGWNSYAGQYATATAPTARWAYQSPCPVLVKPSAGLVDMPTYWINKDPAGSDSTTDWRQSLEALIVNRFDYFPHVLTLIKGSNMNAGEVWKLGCKMLPDLSNIGNQAGFEGSSLQDALLLRALEAVYGVPAPTAVTEVPNLKAVINSSLLTWSQQVNGLLQSVGLNIDVSKPTPPAPPGTTPSTDNVISTLQSVYAVLAQDQNLATLLLEWWDAAIETNGTFADWPQLYAALSNTILPAGQLHNRYLSAIAARFNPLLLGVAGTSPTGRSQHTAVLNPLNNAMLVFGGYDANSNPLNDTWILAPVNSATPGWMQFAPSLLPPAAGSMPLVRGGHSAVFDSITQQMIVFGGAGSGTPFNDVWSLSTSGMPQWSYVNVQGTPPPIRKGHSAVYDQTKGLMIVFGGSPDTAANALNDVSVLAGATGTQAAWTGLNPSGPPGKRMFHSAVYNPTKGIMIVFGGAGPNGLYNDSWLFSLTGGPGGTPSWTQQTPTGGSPAARSSHTAVYDSSSDTMIVFGGNPTPSEIWALSSASTTTPTWTQIQLPSTATPIPPPRQGHSAVYFPGPAAQSTAMLVFSGSPGFAADLWILSNALGTAPAWSQVNPGIAAQLDLAVAAAVAAWVHDSAAAAVPSDPAFVAELDLSVARNLAAAGQSSVAPQAIVPTKRPHPMIIQVGNWNSDTANDDLRRVAGVGLLIRQAGKPWRCLNAATVTVNYGGSTVALPGVSFVPSRLQYRNGIKDPYLTYDNQPLIATSPSTALQGNFNGGMGGWRASTVYQVTTKITDPFGYVQACSVAGTSGATPPKWKDTPGATTPDGTVTWAVQGESLNLLSYAPATGLFAQIYGLTFGVPLDVAPFAIGHGGAMPSLIEAAIYHNPPVEIQDAIPPGIVRLHVPYNRRVPIGHVRVLPKSSGGTWGLNLPMDWPAIPPTVYPLARDLKLTADDPSTSALGNELPLLLLSFGGTFKFFVLPPATDLNTWDRWVAIGNVYTPSATPPGPDPATQTIRKSVWAAYHRDTASVGNSANVATNQIGDPAVGALRFQLEQYNPSADWQYYAGSWQKNTKYGIGNFIIDASGHRQKCTIAGTSAASPPNLWNDTGGTTTDGTVTWTDQGPGAAPPSPWGTPIEVWTQVTYKTPSSGDPTLSPYAWQAVSSAPVPVQVTAPPAGQPTLSYDGTTCTVSVPQGIIARLTVTPMVSDLDYTNRFEQIFKTKTFTMPGTTVPYRRVSVTSDSDANFKVIIESPQQPVSLNQQLKHYFLTNFAPQARILTASVQNMFAQFQSVGKFEIHRQDWRWSGRPIPDFPAAGNAWDLVSWEAAVFGDRLLSDYRNSFKRFSLSAGDTETLLSIDLSGDPRCQYTRFALLAHNRYEGLRNFIPADTQPTDWLGTLIPRQGSMPKPAKPLVRLVLPIVQRSGFGQGSSFDLLVVADGGWLQIGGLGETLTALVQPVLGSLSVTIIFTSGVQEPVLIGNFGDDNGVVYLDTGIALTKVTTGPLTAAGQYSFTKTGTTAQYTFYIGDAGANVTISYLLLDNLGVQHYEYGPDQITDGSAAQLPLPQMTFEPLGATMDDPGTLAPDFPNTYFKGTVAAGATNNISWNQFKIQFRRELQPFGGTTVPAIVSDWTDAIWVQTIPDSASYKGADGNPVALSNVKATWTAAAGIPAALTISPALTPSGPPGSPVHFEFWYVVTLQIVDAFGKSAEVYVPAVGGTPAKPLFDLSGPGSYNVRIIEVQKSPIAADTSTYGPHFDSYIMDPGNVSPADGTPAKDEPVRIVRISQSRPIGIV